MTDTSEKLFNFIAPFYGLFFNYQRIYYDKVLDKAKSILDVSDHSRILDVGCGTGALCCSLSKRGLDVTGVDASEKMLHIARKKLATTKVQFIQASVLETLPFEDKSFDLTISSYMLHGLEEIQREKAYKEMSRISKYKVIYHDYNQKRALHTDIAEYLEGGQYFNFIKNVKREMKDYFKHVQIIDVDRRAAWYIGTPKDS